MEIRDIQPDDRQTLSLALEEAFRPDEVAVALELIDEAIAGSDDYWARVAAGVDGARNGIGGYVCYGPTPMTDGTYDLYWICTAANARGRGVASALIADMERDLRQRGATGIRVETSETEGYGAAQRLYDRLGFPQVAHLADFYRSGDGLIIYYKRL